MKMVGRIRSELKLEPSCGYKTSFCAKRVLAVSWQTADFKVLWWSWFQPLAQEPKTLFYAWAQNMSNFVLKVCLWVLKNKKSRPALVTRVGWGRVHIVKVSLSNSLCSLNQLSRHVSKRTHFILQASPQSAPATELTGTEVSRCYWLPWQFFGPTTLADCTIQSAPDTCLSRVTKSLEQ